MTNNPPSLPLLEMVGLFSQSHYLMTEEEKYLYAGS
ncbi:hypothetical protein ME7_01435, partial [Bartonella birtlesii LL-WM9]